MEYHTVVMVIITEGVFYFSSHSTMCSLCSLCEKVNQSLTDDW